MKEKHFVQARFVTTAVKAEHYPELLDDDGKSLPEVAVVGRSNVGKSSLLNHLFHRKNLVKTSSVPGKTQAVQFFSAGDACLFVDLPGYGYAKVSKSVQKEWGPMMEAYFSHRPSLRLILFLLDIRRTPTEEDATLLLWLLAHNIPTLLVLTKTDKVRRGEKIRNTHAILKKLGHPTFPCLHTSIQDPISREALMDAILTQINSEENEHAA